MSILYYHLPTLSFDFGDFKILKSKYEKLGFKVEVCEKDLGTQIKRILCQ